MEREKKMKQKGSKAEIKQRHEHEHEARITDGVDIKMTVNFIPKQSKSCQ